MSECLPQLFFTLYFEVESSWNSLIQLAWLSCGPLGVSCLCIPSTEILSPLCHPQVFTCLLGIWIQVFILMLIFVPKLVAPLLSVQSGKTPRSKILGKEWWLQDLRNSPSIKYNLTMWQIKYRTFPQGNGTYFCCVLSDQRFTWVKAWPLEEI